MKPSSGGHEKHSLMPVHPMNLISLSILPRVQSVIGVPEQRVSPPVHQDDGGPRSMGVGPLISAYRKLFDVSRHDVVGQEDVAIDVSKSLAGVEKPPSPGIAHQIDDAERMVLGGGCVGLGILRIKIIGLAGVAIGKLKLAVEHEFRIVKKIDLQGQVGLTHQPNRLAAGVSELMPGVERRSKHGSSSESNDTLLVLIGLPEVSFPFSPHNQDLLFEKVMFGLGFSSDWNLHDGVVNESPGSVQKNIGPLDSFALPLPGTQFDGVQIGREAGVNGYVLLLEKLVVGGGPHLLVFTFGTKRISCIVALSPGYAPHKQAEYHQDASYSDLAINVHVHHCPL